MVHLLLQGGAHAIQDGGNKERENKYAVHVIQKDIVYNIIQYVGV